LNKLRIITYNVLGELTIIFLAALVAAIIGFFLVMSNLNFIEVINLKISFEFYFLIILFFLQGLLLQIAAHYLTLDDWKYRLFLIIHFITTLILNIFIMLMIVTHGNTWFLDLISIKHSPSLKYLGQSLGASISIANFIHLFIGIFNFFLLRKY
jgi:hypothetical protein